jgi:16S rRNA processing protein RimM
VTEDDYILIGKIAGAHGVKGYLKMISHAESLSVFTPGSSLLLKKSGNKSIHTIEWVKPHKRNVLLCLKGVENRDQADLLAGSELFIETSLLPELEEGTYYWNDLIGLSVFTIEKTYLGRITSILPTGSNDVYVVKHGKNETLIPALESVVIEINLEDRTMQVDLPEGL